MTIEIVWSKVGAFCDPISIELRVLMHEALLAQDVYWRCGEVVYGCGWWQDNQSRCALRSSQHR